MAFLTIIHHDFPFLFFKKTLFWTIGLWFLFLIVQNACFCKIEIQTLILLTSTKLATKRFIKLFVDVNQSIFQANHLFCNRHWCRLVRCFLDSDKQKNRKPEPAVEIHFRKVFLSFYFLNYLVVIKPSGSTVNSGLSANVPSGLM